MNQVSDSEGSGRFAKRFFSKVHRRNLKGSICSATGGISMAEWEEVEIEAVSDGQMPLRVNLRCI